MAELVDQCDVVFHLAAAVGVKLIVESPVRTIETNVHGTEVVLAQANKKKKKVLIASTSEVYGLSADVPFREDGNLVLGPTHQGALELRLLEGDRRVPGALAYWRERKLPTVVVRLFNTVGPRQTGQYGMVIPTFVKQALAGRPITVYGDGRQSRCFTHVGDVVGALVQADGPPRRGRPGLQHRLELGLQAVLGDEGRLTRVGVVQGAVDVDENLLAAQRTIAVDRRIFQLVSPQLDFHAVAGRGNRHIFQPGHADARTAGDMNACRAGNRHVKLLLERIIVYTARWDYRQR